METDNDHNMSPLVIDLGHMWSVPVCPISLRFILILSSHAQVFQLVTSFKVLSPKFYIHLLYPTILLYVYIFNYF
jgi:hypothetical protein